MKSEIEVIGLSVQGYEEDYIEVFDDHEISGFNNLAASDILEKVGVGPIDELIMSQFTFLDGTEDFENIDEYEEKYGLCKIVEYRKETGNQYPPLYKIKISVEVEPLGLQESEELWKAREAKNNVAG